MQQTSHIIADEAQHDDLSSARRRQRVKPEVVLALREFLYTPNDTTSVEKRRQKRVHRTRR